jgi:hypothetical protein
MRDDPEADARAVRISAEKITAVLAARRYESEIELLLAVGEACPFGHWHDKEIWLRIFYRAAEDAGYYLRT